MSDSLIRPKLNSEFGMLGTWGGGKRRPADPGTNRQQPARRSRASAGPRFGDPGEAQSHEERLTKMIGDIA